ncbi:MULTISPECIES: helix-turn-helix domain-containing protein [Bacillus]|uniref:helix-turn-helix domain-containing protein n=1 Tax=Bacillus TaxID=1386 RepID=UPI000BF684D4|nr:MULTISPECIES: helix-turn-helix transcriptional regulator [Bacillus]PFO18821.1 transcriptional regulator [Bacillus thuringiensis]PGM07203.1 transcriptional regulator [Bacillus thuringiensis]PGU60323.1 transcriptional regulator [Bacillus cereus]PGW24571.1 transcriptional regulator [Bacillus thuringiensis]TKH74727.1 helix-turn-helix transcriptional regulator [Bacillus cereus]
MSETMGSRIQKVRKEKGIRQYELAEAIGVNHTAISLYESGKREPRKDILEKIALVTNVSIDYLYGLTDNKVLNQDKLNKEEIEAAKLMERIMKLPPEKRNIINNLIDNF